MGLVCVALGKWPGSSLYAGPGPEVAHEARVRVDCLSKFFTHI